MYFFCFSYEQGAQIRHFDYLKCMLCVWKWTYACNNPEYLTTGRYMCIFSILLIHFRMGWIQWLRKGWKLTVRNSIKQKHWINLAVFWYQIFVYVFIYKHKTQTVYHDIPQHLFYETVIIFIPYQILSKYNISMRHTLLISYWLKCNCYISLRPHTK